MNGKHAGMTLLELIITLSLTALMLGFAVPTMSDFIANQRITAATNQLIAHLQYARMEAITRHQHVIACPSLDQNSCEGNRWDAGWIIFVDPDRDGQVDRFDDILRVVGQDPRAQISSGGRLRVRFQASGGAYGSNLTIRVCDSRSDRDGRAVIVSNPGRVRMQRRLAHANCTS